MKHGSLQFQICCLLHVLDIELLDVSGFVHVFFSMCFCMLVCVIVLFFFDLLACMFFFAMLDV